MEEPKTPGIADSADMNIDERVFLALSDPTRRSLLDDLYHHDGQRPVDLSVKYDVSRQAVLKHLSVLEEAGLLTAERGGRKTVYYLNHDTFRRLHARWLAKFTRYTVRFEGRDPDHDGVRAS